jgi:hypothetical protein
MLLEQEFQFKKAQIEIFLDTEFEKWFPSDAKISLRQRQKFIQHCRSVVKQRFGGDTLCVLKFTKQGFVSTVLPPKVESTKKGRVFQSFSHSHVYYTTHCLERFNLRMEVDENRIVFLDSLLNEAILTHGDYDGYLVCSEGVFAFEEEKERWIIKTFIGYDLLSDDQRKRFFSLGGISFLPGEMISNGGYQSDFAISDEFETFPEDK